MPLDSILGPQATHLIAYATAVLTAFALLYGFAKIAWAKIAGRPFPDNRFTRALDALAELGSNLVGFVNKVKRGDGSPLIPNPDVVARDATIAELRATLDRLAVSLPVLAEKQGALDVSATRAPEPPHPTPPDGVAHGAQMFSPGFDATARQTIVPPQRDDGQRGSASVRALLGAVVALSVVLPLGVALYGCPRNPPVSGCQPEAQTCINDRPHVCSASQRWHVAGDRSCASIGGVCTVLGGRAYCAPVADAGADAGDVE